MSTNSTVRTLGLVGALLLPPIAATPVAAQQSASFKLTERVLNAGGHPAHGVVMASASFLITLDALGDGVVQVGMSSASYRMEAGFASGYPPPGEVTDLLFTSRQTLEWDAELSAGSYNLYRDAVGNLSELDYGACQQPGLSDEMTTDSDLPLPGEAFFYLVTAENRLGEEGTKGFQGDGTTERLGTVCP